MKLVGAWSSFSAGADLKAFDSLGAQDDPSDLDFVYRGTGYLGFNCFAGGLDMACWCDIRIAGSGAQFGCLERRFGASLLDCGTQRLARIIGLGRALDLVFTGRQIDATHALQWGHVTELVDDEKVLDRDPELWSQIAAYPQGRDSNRQTGAAWGGTCRWRRTSGWSANRVCPTCAGAEIERFRNRAR